MTYFNFSDTNRATLHLVVPGLPTTLEIQMSYRSGVSVCVLNAITFDLDVWHSIQVNFEGQWHRFSRSQEKKIAKVVGTTSSKGILVLYKISRP